MQPPLGTGSVPINTRGVGCGGQGVGVLVDRAVTKVVVAAMVLAALSVADGYPRQAHAAVVGVTVNGNQLLKDGLPFYPRGFNMIGVLAPDGCAKVTALAKGARESFGERELLAARVEWSANTVRLQVSQRGLDPRDSMYRASYLTRVVEGVALARRLGFVVVVSMQDQVLGCGSVHPLPTAATERAWRNLAPVLMADPYVIFELFNEPDNDTSASGWAQWRNGGSKPLSNLGQVAVGHQKLLTVLRSIGVRNVVLADGARKAGRFAGIPLLSDPLQPAQVGYSVHPYYFHNFATATLTQDRNGWESRFGFMTRRAVLLATEWNTTSTNCTAGGDARAPDLLRYLHEKNIGLLGHAFDVPNTMVRNRDTWPPTTLDGYGCKVVGPDAGQLVQDHFRELAGIDVDRLPTVVLTSPVSGAAVPSTFPVVAVAQDDGQVTRLVLQVDGVDHSDFSFTPSRDVAAATQVSLAPGRHLLTAVAYDSASPQPQSFTSVPVEVDVAPAPGCSAGPASPHDVSTSATSQRVKLSWQGSTVPDGCPPVGGYRVLRGLDDGSPLEPAGEVEGTGFTDVGIGAGSTYRYVVEAFDTQGVSARSPEVVVTVPEAPCASALSAPAALRQTSATYTSIALSWEDVSVPAGCGLGTYRVLRDDVVVAEVTQPSYVDDSLTSGQTRHYTVVAVEDGGAVSPPSAVLVASTSADDQPPAAASWVRALPVTGPAIGVDFSWAPASDQPEWGGSGVAAYRIYRNDQTRGPIAEVAPPLTTYTDSSVASATFYGYRVTAVDAAGNESAFSPMATATTASVADTVAPSAPTGVAARALMPAQVRITWTRSTDTGGSGLAGYAVYRSGRTAPLRVLNDPATTEFLDTTTAAGTSYTYRVEAFDGRNNRSGQASAPAVRTPRLNDSVRPAAPKGLTVTSVARSSVSLRWTAVTDGGSGIAGYHVYRGGVHVGDGIGTNYTDRGLRPATRYTYTVVAYDRAANNSSASAALSVRTTPAAVEVDGATGASSGGRFA